MPSKLKRINLTVPEVVYEQIKVYKDANGIISDASACLQLIQQQLKAQEESKIMMNLVKSLSPEQLIELATTGVQDAKRFFDK